MARKSSTRSGHSIDHESFDRAGANVYDSDLPDEIQASFGEYAYSVIHERALPDARDGLKPVHRRVLYSMADSGLWPTRGYVKCARVVGDVMGNYHPHGDSAIYDALVRLAQDFVQNAVLIDGHGNFGTPSDSAAASRYTECRLSPVAVTMVEGLDEDTVDFVPNYDNSTTEPKVLPAAFPNLLVNGSAGIAVGMATNMIPHNLGEVIAAARHLITHPNTTLDGLMRFIPGPDLPTGGMILGLDELRRAYETGRGVIRIRARYTVEQISNSRGRKALIFTDLPYGEGPERIIEKIQEAVGKKQLQSLADVKDLTDQNGVRLAVECKMGADLEAVAAELYRLTPLETTFGINNNVLVDDVPRVLGLKELLEVFLAHRYEVVTRRSRFRLAKAEARRHLVEGLLAALDNIDQVVRIIRSSRNSAEAKGRLVAELADCQVLLGGSQARVGLDEEQAQYILDMPLRRLTSLEVEALRSEWDELTATIVELRSILDDETKLKRIVSDELKEIAAKYATPRRTELIYGDLDEILAAERPPAAEPEPVRPGDPCRIVLGATGRIGKLVDTDIELTLLDLAEPDRAQHDVIRSVAASDTNGRVLLVTSRGRAIRLEVDEIAQVAPRDGLVALAGATPVRELVNLDMGERPLALIPYGSHADGGVGLACATRGGVVKVTAPDWPVRSREFDIMKLKDGDEIVAAGWVAQPEDFLVFLATDAQLLYYPASEVRPQGRSGGGMAGMRLAAGATVVGFAVVHGPAKEAIVTAVTGVTVKRTSLGLYPTKGRATAGVRSQRFIRGEKAIFASWIGAGPVACTPTGGPLELPGHVTGSRDGSGDRAHLAPDTVLGERVR